MAERVFVCGEGTVGWWCWWADVFVGLQAESVDVGLEGWLV